MITPPGLYNSMLAVMTTSTKNRDKILCIPPVTLMIRAVNKASNPSWTWAKTKRALPILKRNRYMMVRKKMDARREKWIDWREPKYVSVSLVSIKSPAPNRSETKRTLMSIRVRSRVLNSDVGSGERLSFITGVSLQGRQPSGIWEDTWTPLGHQLTRPRIPLAWAQA